MKTAGKRSALSANYWRKCNLKPEKVSAYQQAICRRLGFFRDEMRLRLIATRDLFAIPIVTVDPHIHSDYSDGLGTVEDILGVAEQMGIDLIYVTDHFTIDQKADTDNLGDKVSWGQEPAMGHHIGVLENDFPLQLRESETVVENLALAQELGVFAWVPHPTGWYPGVHYEDERIEEMYKIPYDFAMEVINGANKLTTRFDNFITEYVRLWDRLLMNGIKITPIGGSDAHTPDEVGIAWTGAYIDRPESGIVLKCFNAGRCFASQAPCIALWVNDEVNVGDEMSRPEGDSIKVKVRAADSAGLATVYIVADGHRIVRFRAKGEKVVEAECDVKLSDVTRYVRAEVVSSDKLRAYTAPIYIKQG